MPRLRRQSDGVPAPPDRVRHRVTVRRQQVPHRAATTPDQARHGTTAKPAGADHHVTVRRQQVLHRAVTAPDQARHGATARRDQVKDAVETDEVR